MNATGVVGARGRHPGHRPDRRRAAGRQRHRRDPQPRRPDRPARLRARSARPTQTTAGPARRRPAADVPAAVLRRRARQRARSAPTSRAGATVDFALKDKGKKLFADYTAAAHRRLLRDRPRRRGHLRARSSTSAIPGGNVQITPAAHRRLPAEGGAEPRHVLAVRLAAVPGRGARQATTVSPTLGEAVPRTRACSPARSRSLLVDPVHAHPLPAAGRRRELRAALLRARRATRCSGSSRSR